MQYSQRRDGFTLVELAIVLVIIGLLMGGLAGLKSYTRNAAMTTMMNESKYFTSAFNQFQTRYNNPPGDYCSTATVCGTDASPTVSTVWPTANNGDGNGLIRAASTPVISEYYMTFQHLALAGFIQGKFSGAANGTGGATINLNVPGSAIQKTAFLFDHPDATDGIIDGSGGTHTSTLYFNGVYSNILRVAGLNDASTTIPDQPFLTPKQTLQIDEKYDDGLPGKGNVMVPISTALANCATTADPATALYDTSATYAEQKKCYLILRMQ